MIYRGDCYWIDLPLPGSVGLGPHAAFVFSSTDANERNDYVLMSSSHRRARHPWAFWIASEDHYRHRESSTRPRFDISRPIGVEQMVSVSKADLPTAREGELSYEALDGSGSTNRFGADSAIRVQFALPGYLSDLSRLGWQQEDLTSYASQADAPQFSIWEAALAGQRTTCVVVSNDKHNTHADHVQVLEISPPTDNEASCAIGHGAGAVTLRMKLVLRPGARNDSLLSRVGDLTPAERRAVISLLTDGVGLAQK